MVAPTDTWDLLRAIGEHAARGLAAVEQSVVHDRARRNAAWAAAQASARRREAADVERWIGAVHSGSDQPPGSRSARG